MTSSDKINSSSPARIETPQVLEKIPAVETKPLTETGIKAEKAAEDALNKSPAAEKQQMHPVDKENIPPGHKSEEALPPKKWVEDKIKNADKAEPANTRQRSNSFDRSPKLHPSLIRADTVRRLSVDVKIEKTQNKKSAEDILSAEPKDLEKWCAQGLIVDGTTLKEAVDAHAETYKKGKDPELGTTLHILYDLAAEISLKNKNPKEAFAARSAAATTIKFSDKHLLHNMDKAIDDGTDKDNEHMGAYFSKFDTATVKGQHMRAFNRNIKKEHHHCFDFKVSKSAKNKITETIKAIEGNLQDFKKSLPPELRECKMNITTVKHGFKGKDKEGTFSEEAGFTPEGAEATQVEFEGVGRIIIGGDSHKCLENSVGLELYKDIAPGKCLETMHQMTAVLGLGPIVGTPRKVDEDRLKMGTILHRCAPEIHALLEPHGAIYRIPIDELMEGDIEGITEGQKKEVKRLSDHYFKEKPELIKEKDIHPGYTVYAIEDVAEQMRINGSYGLMMGVGGNTSIERASEITMSILNKGALLTQHRFESNMIIPGVCSGIDLKTGGGSSVFFRLINDKLISQEISAFPYSGQVQILFDLDVVNDATTYAYKENSCGTKDPKKHARRQSVSNFPKTLDKAHTENELMVKDRVPANRIIGLVVQDDKKAEVLKNQLRTSGFVRKEDGKEVVYLDNKPVKPLDEFVHVASQFDKDMWKKEK